MKPWNETGMNQELWDTILLWSGYDRDYTIREIARQTHVSRRTVYSRIRHFEELFPEAYSRIAKDKQMSKKLRQKQFKTMKHPTSFTTDMEEHVKEKF